MYIGKYDYEIKGMFFNSLNNKHSNHLFMMSAPSKKEGYTDKKKTRSTGETKSASAAIVKDTKQECITPNSDSITFQIKTTDKPEIYDLYAVNDKSGVVEKYAIALIKKMAVSKILNKYFSSEDGDKSCFCYCKYNKKFNKWEVIGLNSDATLPDSLNTIKNMEE